MVSRRHTETQALALPIEYSSTKECTAVNAAVYQVYLVVFSNFERSALFPQISWAYLVPGRYQALLCHAAYVRLASGVADH